MKKVISLVLFFLLLGSSLQAGGGYRYYYNYHQSFPFRYSCTVRYYLPFHYPLYIRYSAEDFGEACSLAWKNCFRLTYYYGGYCHSHEQPPAPYESNPLPKYYPRS